MDYEYYIGMLETALNIELYAEDAAKVIEYLKEYYDEIVYEYTSLHDDELMYMKPEKKEKLVDEAVVNDLIDFYNNEIKEN